MRLIASVKNALQQRQDKKDQYLSSLTDVEAKQIAHNKIALATAKEDQASVKLVSALHLCHTRLALSSCPSYFPHAFHSSTFLLASSLLFSVPQALVYKAQAVAKEAKLEYEGVTQRVISEFEVFKCQKMVDMRDILLNFVNMQVRPIEMHSPPLPSSPFLLALAEVPYTALVTPLFC